MRARFSHEASHSCWWSGAGEKGLAKGTHRDYAAVSTQFTAWLSRQHGWPDPLANLASVKGDEVCLRRRALTMEELHRLLDAAERRPAEEFLRRNPNASPATLDRLRREGCERSMTYKVGAWARLRLNEVRTLRWCNAVLDAEPALLTAEARYGEDTVPICGELAEALRARRRLQQEGLGHDVDGKATVFRMALHPERAFQRDAEYASIETKDTGVGAVDLYAATRHTFCTILGRSSMAPHAQRLLMRHTELRMTQRYTRLVIGDRSSALSTVRFGSLAENGRNGKGVLGRDGALLCREGPEEQEAMKATGTEGKPLEGRDLAQPCATVYKDGPKEKLVGAAGFEPATSCSQSRRASQAALRPDPGGKDESTG